MLAAVFSFFPLSLFSPAFLLPFAHFVFLFCISLRFSKLIRVSFLVLLILLILHACSLPSATLFSLFFAHFVSLRFAPLTLLPLPPLHHQPKRIPQPIHRSTCESDHIDRCATRLHPHPGGAGAGGGLAAGEEGDLYAVWGLR